METKTDKSDAGRGFCSAVNRGDRTLSQAFPVFTPSAKHDTVSKSPSGATSVSITMDDGEAFQGTGSEGAEEEEKSSGVERGWCEMRRHVYSR